MKLGKFLKQINRMKDIFDENETDIVFRIGKAEYPVEYVMTNGGDETESKCVLKIDDLAEMDLVYKIIEASKNNG